MLSSVLTNPEELPALDKLRPAPIADGIEPEERISVYGISWDGYLAFDKALGNDRPGPRLYYLDGELEIMTTSDEHERIKKWISGFMDDFFIQEEIEVIPRGQATMRLAAMKKAGAEPDESWCIEEEKEFPDLVLEIALTSGGVNKLEVYRRFRVPEVWLWRRYKLEIFGLLSSGEYKRLHRSRLLPALNISLIERCVAIPSWQQARRAFRAGLLRSGKA